MKVLTRSYVWWPKLNSEIENLVRTCEQCQQSRASPPHTPVHKWESPRIPWSRIHVDLAGPIYGKNFLIVVDTFSKRLEVRVLKKTRHPNHIHGLPDIIVSDNGTVVDTVTRSRYLKIPRDTISQAERMVRTTKEFLKKMTQRDWEYNLANFLFCQHVTPCTTTGKSRAELLMNRRLRAVLDRLQPDVVPEDLDKKFEKVRTFQTEDQEYAKNYSSEKTWKPAIVVTPTGPLSYQVQIEDGKLWRRHINQLRKRYVTAEQNHSAEKVESHEDETAEKTVEAITEEDTAVADAGRQLTTAVLL
ncbi:Uncharacterized protein T12_11201 [Trichinella patagoniensis]|uniref:RNA-directed DNA polymerase n=1 Tax=Trichinella patagoniensis TaxID=990121 RepID=A0A0V1A672_9BILA|nr:Uncharacterized protein T12_11201 [Trichinella patagoniensis]